MQRFIFTIIFIVLMGHTAQADSVQSLREALYQAYFENTELKAARARVRATQEDYAIAVGGWLPTIDATAGIRQSWQSGDNIRQGQDSGTTTESRLGINQALYRGGRTQAEMGEARHRIRADRAELLSREQTIFLNTTREYMNVVRDRALLMLRQNNEVVLNKQLEVTVTRFAGGDVSQTDVEQARARVARARAETLEAEANLALSEARFQQFVGRGMDEKVAIPALAEDLPATLDDAIKLALQHNPELEELANLHRAAQNTVDVRYSALLPQVSFSASSRYEDDPVPGDKRYSRLDSIGVNLRVPIFEGGIERARVRKARHQVDQRQYELDERRRDVRQRVISQWNEYEAAKEAIASREMQVRAAKVARDGVTKEAQGGERSVFDILEAEQELLDAEVSLVTAQRNAIVREYTLKATLGMLTAQQLALNSDGIYSPEEHFRDSKHQFFSTRIRAE